MSPAAGHGTAKTRRRTSLTKSSGIAKAHVLSLKRRAYGDLPDGLDGGLMPSVVGAWGHMQRLAEAHENLTSSMDNVVDAQVVDWAKRAKMSSSKACCH